MKNSPEKLIGYYNGISIELDENGIVYLKPMDKIEQKNKEISTINWEIKHTTHTLQEIVNTQNKLRYLIRTHESYLTKKQIDNVKKQITDNRAIIKGFSVYISVLKHKKNEIQKTHPKNMKPLRTKEEKLQNSYDRLIKRCHDCHGNFNDDCRDCSYLDKRCDLLKKLEKIKTNNSK